jgi:cytochrome c oxidase subunit 4
MSTDIAATDHAAETHDHDAHGHDTAEHHNPDSYYIRIAVFLAVLTALETSTYYVDFGPFFMPALLGMMVIKFVTVILFFMHLKDDHKLFSWLFYAGLGLAIGVYVAALLTFRFFG